MSGFEPPGRGIGEGMGENENGRNDHVEGFGSGFDPDELRRRMRDAVSGIEPAEGSLERLRHAVPARRRRRSALMVGTSALVMVGALAAATRGAPGWVASVTRSVERTATIGGSGAISRQGSGANGAGASEQQDRTGGASGPSVDPSGTATPGKPSATPAPSPSSTVTPRPGNPALPQCGTATLGQPTFTADDTVDDGVTYGRVDGTVLSSCDLTSQPAVAVAPSTGSGAPVTTVGNGSAHYQGLPDVTPAAPTTAMKSDSTFEFQFAWVPTTCPSTSSNATQGTSDGAVQATDAPSATPTPTDTTAPPTTYQMSYTAAASGPTATTTLSAACGATVYVTAVYPGGQYPQATATP